MYQGPICLGLTPQSTNEEIKTAAFNFAFSIGYMAFATTAIDGKTPTSRGLEVHRLDDVGNMYVGASRGKHFYDEIEVFPYVCGIAINDIAVRINAYVKKIDDMHIRKRYWQQNRGTEALYRKDLDNFQIYLLESGEGEVFHVYQDDKIARLRFYFGDQKIRPWMYTINDKCNACGICEKNCMTDIITIHDNKACIDYYGCNECGICYFSCPHEAIDKEDFV
ncbi:MAG: hypothetical protein FWG61_05575 [Firmicutes bacterium]|nr:hypothetical protein [Bacillota bacterium]